MRICHVTPHLPPDQAANALLPVHLGRWAKEAGHRVVYVTHPQPGGRDYAPDLPGRVIGVRRRSDGRAALKKLHGLADAVRIARATSVVLSSADLVHVHGNGLLAETCAVLARGHKKPVVLTLYGTEIWHYRRKIGLDLFTRAYRRASCVIFYSQALLDKASELGLSRGQMSVIYPPVADPFKAVSGEERRAIREELGVGTGPLLVNVKRLHPLGGHAHLIDAVAQVRSDIRDLRLIICGTGSLRRDLEQRAARHGLEGTIQFQGLVDNEAVARYDAAADLFVLPSLLEACPTVALEALACGTPVVSSDNPGGVELHGLFGDDVAVVPREDPGRLAGALLRALAAPRRVSEPTLLAIERDFRLQATAERYLRVYQDASGSDGY